VTDEVKKMTERTTTPTATTGATKARGPRGAAKTDTGPIVVPTPEAGSTPAASDAPAAPDATQVLDVPATPPIGTPPIGTPPSSAPPSSTSAPHPTAPVTVRPKPRGSRSGPLTRMGPWAPVAGGLLGVVAGIVAVLFLAGAIDTFAERLSLVLLVVGLGTLGAAGVLLADEVRMVRQGAREAAVRPAWVEATVPLLSGLTPARLLLVLSAFVLFLSAYVIR
jgi:hypothetical protein